MPTYWAPPFCSILDKSLYKVAQLWLKLGSNFLFSPRDIFWKSWLLLLCAYSVLSANNISKKSLRTNHQRRLHNCDLNWAWSRPRERNFLEKLTNITLFFYIALCNMISKISWDSKSQGCIIYAQIDPYCKREFPWKIDWFY